MNIHIFHSPSMLIDIHVHVNALDLMMMLICMHDDESVMVSARHGMAWHGTARHGTARGSFSSCTVDLDFLQVHQFQIHFLHV